MIRGHYIDGPLGQIHGWVYNHSGKNARPQTILCLPPSPYSGRAYHSLAPFLAQHYNVVALDYPGCGNSQMRADHIPIISDFAAAALSWIDNHIRNVEVYLLGFHTGCFVAVEAALQRDGLKPILIDIPFFSDARRKQLIQKSIGVIPENSGLEIFLDAWRMSFEKQYHAVGFTRALTIFSDHLSTGQNANLVFNAAFNYRVEEKFSQLTAPTTILATKAGLFDETIAAASLIQNASLMKAENIKASVLEAHAPNIADFLSKLAN